jgi:PAS domain S-box-containing protein
VGASRTAGDFAHCARAQGALSWVAVALLRSLRGRLLGLVLVGVLPSFGILAYAERHQRAYLLQEFEDGARDLARLVAERHQRAVDRARGLLVVVSLLPSVRGLDGEACARELAPVLAEAPLYANVGAVRRDGTLFCSAARLSAEVNLSDRPHVRGPLDGGGFTVGGYMRSRSRGRMASFGFGHPVRDERGEVIGAAVASFDLAQVQRDLDDLPLPDGAEVVVVDGGGLVLTGRPAPGASTGEPLDARLLAAAVAGRPVELAGGDGVARLWAFHAVAGAGGEAVMRAAVGIPAAAAHAPVNRVVRTSMLAFLGVAALALGAALVGGELLVVRRLRAVIAAARRIAAGDHTARTGVAAGREEIGELVGAFDEMAASLERLTRQNRLLLDAVGDGVVGLDAKGRIIFANPAAVRALGWAEGELLGREAHGLVHCGGADGTASTAEECRILAVMREGSERHGSDEALRRADGSTFSIDYVCTPVVDSGAVVGAVLVFKDSSERRRMEERLRQAEKMEAIGQLAGGVAHDFNNLLTAIVSCTQLVRGELPAEHASQADLREIEMAAARATALTRQLLAFSRRQRLAPRVVELRAIVRGMESMLRRLLPESVSLRVDAPVPGTVIADPAQLEMAVLNLAVNARDAMPSGGRIEIAVAELEAGGDDGLPEGPLAVLSVRDDGVGMDPGTRERVFEPFFTTKPPGKGTGLGLSTVYGIVSQSGGAIRVRSAPGHGSDFRIYLPRERPAQAERAAPDVAPAPPGEETILLVEDDAAIREIARRTLSRAGYRVLDAGTPTDALRLAHGANVHLLVSDVILPGRDGWQLSRDLVALHPRLRVLFMSGYAARPGGEPLLPEGVPFLAKPFAPEELLRCVRASLDAAPARPQGDAIAAGATSVVNRRA